MEPSQLPDAATNVGDDGSPPPGYATAASSPGRIHQHPIFDLQYSTPANRDDNSDHNPGPPSGEVVTTSSRESGVPIGEVDTGGIATPTNPPGCDAVADGPTPSSSTANEAAFESGPPGDTYSRLPINRLGHQPNAEEHLYQGGPLYQ